MLEGSVEVSDKSTKKRKRAVMEGGENAQNDSFSSDLQKLPWSPDSVPKMVSELRKLIDYVQQKPHLMDGSASFMRDYLRTLLVRCAREAEKSYSTDSTLGEDPSASSYISTDEPVTAVMNASEQFFSDEHMLKNVFRNLNAKDLSKVRGVSRFWKKCGDDPILWKRLCFQQRWKSLDYDSHLWTLLGEDIDVSSPNRWQIIYPSLVKKSWWKCKLKKTSKFVCNLIVHQVYGESLGETFPSTLSVERRFALAHLNGDMVPMTSPILYFEPEAEKDRKGLEEFIQYLIHRDRAGLALVDSKRYIFIPPCNFCKERGYDGLSLLGAVLPGATASGGAGLNQGGFPADFTRFGAT